MVLTFLAQYKKADFILWLLSCLYVGILFDSTVAAGSGSGVAGGLREPRCRKMDPDDIQFG